MKKIIGLPILIILFLGLAGMVYGTATFKAPLSNADGLGTRAVINVTVGLDNVTHCLVTASSSASGGTLAAVNLTNQTGIPAEGYNATIDTTTMRDATDWVFTGTCYNATVATESITSTTGIEIDNGVPQISGCTLNSATPTGKTLVEESTNSFSCTVFNATSCNVYWKDSTANAMTTDFSDVDCTFTPSSSYAAAGFGTTCTISQAKDNNNSIYYDCTDGTNTTTGTAYGVFLGGYSAPQVQRKKALGIPTQVTSFVNLLAANKLLVLLGAAVVLMGGIWYFNFRKK